jgi:DNA-binding NarL/FixJ family response regulator
MNNTLTVLVADDHKVFAEGLVAVLRIKFPLALFTVVHSGEEAWERIESNPRFQFVITDISMSGITGLELATRIKQQHPLIKVLILSMHNERQIVAAALATEAEGFLLKTSSALEIVNAINDILNDSTHYSREVLQVLLDKIKDEKQSVIQDPLTARELEILKLILEENSNEQMAEKLFISKRTVETHRQHIMEKTGCRNLIALYKFASRNGLIPS